MDVRFFKIVECILIGDASSSYQYSDGRVVHSLEGREGEGGEGEGRSVPCGRCSLLLLTLTGWLTASNF